MIITEDTTLNGNHNGNIIIGANGITLDCDDNDVIGPGTDIDVGPPSGPAVLRDIGIMLTKRRDVIIKNCNVYGFDTAFRLDKSKRNELKNNTAVDNGRFGFLLIDSDRNELEDNTADDNFRNGFLLVGSDDNSLVGNTATNNGLGDASAVGHADGFQFFQSDDNTVTENTAEDNLRHGFLFFQSDDNTVVGNTSNSNDFNGFVLFDERDPDVVPPFGVDGSDYNTFVENTADSNRRNGFRVVGESQNNTLRENEGSGNDVSSSGAFDALDDDIPAGFDNDWVDNDFGTCSGFLDPPCFP